MKNRYIFLDDIRTPIVGDWEVYRDPHSAFEATCIAIKDGCRVNLSLDHDLGDGVATGYDFLCWLEKFIQESTKPTALGIEVHSQNPVGRDNMLRAIQSIYRFVT